MKTCKIWLIFLLLSMSSHVQATLISNSNYPHFFELESYVDKSAKLSLDEVIKLDAWRTQENNFAFGYAPDNFWLKITFTNVSDVPLSSVLWLTETFFHEVNFYERQDENWIIRTHGLHIPSNQRNVLDTFPNHHLVLEPKKEQVIYIKMNGEFGNFGAFLLNSKEDFYTHIFARSMAFSAMIVALIMLSIFYLIVHLYLREMSFVYYSLFSLSYSVWVALYNGIIPMFFNEWVHSILQIFMPIAFIFLIKFSQSILDTQKYRPNFHWLLNFLVALYIFAVIIIPFDVQSGFMVHNLAATITMPILMVLSLISLSRKEQIIKLYTIGLFAFFSGMTILALLALGYFPYNILTRNAPFPGSVIEFAFFAYILMLKVFQMQDDKETSYRKLTQMQEQAQVRLTEQVEERTLQLKKVLDKKQKVIKQYSYFISLITHELRNPLGIIKSQLALMEKEKEKGIDNSNGRLKTMAMTTQRMELLFDDWLVSDKLEQELFSLQIETIELSDWIKSIEGMTQQIYSSHHFKFEYQVVQINVDVSLFKLALYNLVDNAVKYSRPGSYIVVKVEQIHDWVNIIIEDQGIGVSPEESTLIFERFKRGRQDGQVRGTGLGLSLVKSVMELHQGRVYLDTEYKKGSRFVLSFKNQSIAYPTVKLNLK